MKLAIKVLRRGAIAPRYATYGSAGMDLYVDLPKGEPSIKIPPKKTVVLGTGLAFAIEEGYEGQVRSRSGLSTKEGLVVAGGVGTIDADYRGEVMIPILNVSSKTRVIEDGQRVAQIVFARVAKADIQIVYRLPGTNRGEGGFGSSGR